MPEYRGKQYEHINIGYGSCEGCYFEDIDGCPNNLCRGNTILKEKEMNEMPKLEPGMLVEMCGEQYIYFNESYVMNLNGIAWNSSVFVGCVSKVWKMPRTSFRSLQEHCNTIPPIWQRETEKDRKLRELQETIDNAQKQIKELRDAD